MSVIDKIVNEWAFRCKKGYPDMNDPNDMKILKEIYSEYGIVLEEEKPKEEPVYSADDLITLLQDKKADLDSAFIQKMYHTIITKGQKLGSQIAATLQQKGLEASSNEIFSIINQYAGLEQYLSDFFKNEKKQVTIEQLKAGTDIVSTTMQATGLPEGFLNTLIKSGKATEGGKGVGEGEALLALVGRGGKKLKVGDVEIEDKEIEVKGTGGRLIGRAEPLTDLYKNLTQLGVPARRGGKEAVHTYIPYILATKPDVEKEVRKLLQKEFNTKPEVDLTSEQSVYSSMLEWYVDYFLNNEAKAVDYILVLLGREYRLYTKEEFKEAALSGTLKFKNFSATNKSPQILSFA